MSNTKHLADLVKVCSILPALVIMPAMVNAAERQEFVAGEKVKITNQSVSGHKEIENWAGGLYLVSKQSELTIRGGRYTNNANNAIILNKDGSVYARGAGGVVGQGTGLLKVQDYDGQRASFVGNSAIAAGGALWLGDRAEITNSDFIGNKVVGVEDTAGVSIDGGGALFLGATSKTVLNDVLFNGNSSAVEGGAISMRSATQGNNSQAKLDIFDSDFIGNTAVTNGGAIYSTFYDSETVKNSVYINDTDFTSNSAKNGGAIYVEGLMDLGGGKASMKVVDADFERNTATEMGGAVYNASNLTLTDVDFKFNTANTLGGAIYSSGKLDLDKVNFVSNSVIEEDGGALYITGGQENNITNSTFRDNHADNYSGGAILLQNGVLNIDNTTFVGNTAMESGAIFTYSSQPNTLNITNSVFDSNMALSAGAVQAMYQANISDTVFKNNIATTNADGAGALFVGAVGKAVLDNVTFENNRADYRGGAISTRSADLGNNKDAKLDVLNSKFIGNKAGTTGGAFDNYLYSSVADDTAVYFEKVEFSANSAALGGAVYNHGAEDRGGNTASTHINGVTFTGNIATDAGGAVYNEAKGALMLSGTNTFSGNTANGVANDIYNDGALTIASGETMLDGGITGNGALDIKSDATLNINYASIEQDTINIDGTLMASLLNDKDSLDIVGTLSGTGTVLLSAGATGTYDVSLFADANLGVEFGKTYDVEFNDDNTKATLTTRDAQSIAADTGASIAAAGAVSGLAASTDATIQQVSLRAQAALNNGDIALVEKEMAKANPDTKPVSQSVAASVQNQVVTMAAGRMSAIGGGATGRAGGDVTGAGVWTQGVFNKSKFADKFHGYTRGFAIGGDTLIDNVLTIGGGYAFSNSDIHADGRNMDVENNSIFMYAQYKPAAWYVNATLNYTKSDYADASTVFGYLLNDEYETKSYGAQAMFGYDFANGVTPEFGMRYLHVSQEDHVDVMNREIAGMDADFLSGVAGLKYAFTIESDSAVKFSPTMRAAMTYDFLSDDATATVVVPGASAYYVDVDRLSRLGGEFGIGLTAEYRGLEVSLNYELDLHQDYTSQTGLLKFRYDF